MKEEDRKIEVVVEIENGLVEGIYSTDPDVEVSILDMDTSDTERYEDPKERLRKSRRAARLGKA